MSYRQYNNDQNLPLKVLIFRLLSADPNAEMRIERVDIINPQTLEVIGVRQQLSIQSDILTDQQIENGLANPITAAETAAINRFLASKTAIADIPNWATWTEAQALSWIDTNIAQPLAVPIPPNPMTVQQIRAVLVALVAVMNSMTQVLIGLARLVVALRDHIRPEQ